MTFERTKVRIQGMKDKWILEIKPNAKRINKNGKAQSPKGPMKVDSLLPSFLNSSLSNLLKTNSHSRNFVSAVSIRLH